jgi:hypothetical protein
MFLSGIHLDSLSLAVDGSPGFPLKARGNDNSLKEGTMSTPTDIRGLHLGSLSMLAPIFKYWQTLNETWIDTGDAPWWYNERSSVGFLAGAIWKNGGWALEEFGTDKWVGSNKKKTFSGRCDIAFGVDGQDFWGEAKQCWPTLNGTNNSGMVIANLDRADKQVKSGKARGYKGVAIAFVVPKVLKANRRQIDNHITSYVDQLEKTIPNVTLAWTFPAQTRYLYPGNDWRGYFFPGIIIALRPVK